MCEPTLFIIAPRAARASRICCSDAGALIDAARGWDEDEEVVGEVVVVVAAIDDVVGTFGSVLAVDMMRMVVDDLSIIQQSQQWHW